MQIWGGARTGRPGNCTKSRGPTGCCRLRQRLNKKPVNEIDAKLQNAGTYSGLPSSRRGSLLTGVLKRPAQKPLTRILTRSRKRWQAKFTAATCGRFPRGRKKAMFPPSRLGRRFNWGRLPSVPIRRLFVNGSAPKEKKGADFTEILGWLGEFLPTIVVPASGCGEGTEE